MSNNTGNSLLAVLVGAAIGVGVGVLFAPEKGSKTRKKIKEGLDDTKENLKHKMDEASDQFKTKFSGAKYDLDESYEEFVSNVSNKTEEVISFLEAKLANLKEKNARFQKKEYSNHSDEIS